ncbi:hypothetical protein [Mycolicibacterium mengxianglii]|uniref:hypothetical protein n=1 Tax=Mycolicibacterium mengxianglii TaxID=2736649 RepID=UPI0018EEE14B|nr:hypothetical protein [Mycolicibacterium mengxianglii]
MLQLFLLLVAVAVVAATFGYIGSVAVRRRSRRRRGAFLLGFLCGSAVGIILPQRRRRLRLLTAVRRS